MANLDDELLLVVKEKRLDGVSFLSRAAHVCELAEFLFLLLTPSLCLLVAILEVFFRPWWLANVAFYLIGACLVGLALAWCLSRAFSMWDRANQRR